MLDYNTPIVASKPIFIWFKAYMNVDCLMLFEKTGTYLTRKISTHFQNFQRCPSTSNSVLFFSALFVQTEGEFSCALLENTKIPDKGKMTRAFREILWNNIEG